MPDTFITVCEFDPLRDDGLLYAQRLASADVPVMLRREPQMVHGYLHGWTLSPGARAAFEALCAALRHMARDRTGQTF